MPWNRSIEAHLPLNGHVAETSRDAEHKGVEVLQRVDGGDGVVRLGRSFHDYEELRGEGLSDSKVKGISAPQAHPIMKEATDWRIVALPPAASIPAFSASATEIFDELQNFINFHPRLISSYFRRCGRRGCR